MARRPVPVRADCCSGWRLFGVRAATIRSRVRAGCCSEEHRCGRRVGRRSRAGADRSCGTVRSPGRSSGTPATGSPTACSWTAWPNSSPVTGSGRRRPSAPSPRRASGRVWIIDPLDGTREYSEGREDWAVHVALAIDGEAVVGGVALPAMGLVLGTEDPPTARRAGRGAPAGGQPEPASGVHPRSSPSGWGRPRCAMGSAGAKIAAVIRGEAEVYLHAGGQYEWDSAAPVAVALASGSPRQPARRVAPASTRSRIRGCPTWWSAIRR